MRRRSLFVRAGVLVLALASVACSYLIALDDKGPRPPATDASTGDRSDVVGSDTGVDPTGCANAVFCDDFDEPGQRPGSHWSGAPSKGLFSGENVSHDAGDASLAIVQSEFAPTPPSVLEAKVAADETTARSYALLATEFDGSVASRGFVISFQMQMHDFADLKDAAADAFREVGPDPALYNESTVGLAGFVVVVGGNRLYSGLIGATKSGLMVSEGETTANYARVAQITSIGDFLDQTWLKVTLATGMRDRVIAFAQSQNRPAPACPPDALYVTAAWTGITTDQAGCVISDPSASPVAQRADFAVILGGLTTDPLQARIRFDSLRIDSLP